MQKMKKELVQQFRISDRDVCGDFRFRFSIPLKYHLHFLLSDIQITWLGVSDRF